MNKSIGVVMCASALMVAGDVGAQGMLLDYAADKVIQKYHSELNALHLKGRFRIRAPLFAGRYS